MTQRVRPKGKNMENMMDSAPDTSLRFMWSETGRTLTLRGCALWSMWWDNLGDIYLSILCSSESPTVETLVQREAPHLLSTQGRSGGEELTNWTALFRNLISNEKFFSSLVYSEESLQSCHVVDPEETA